MKRVILSLCLFIGIIFTSGKIFSQTAIETGDPLNNTDIPDFFKSRINDIEKEVNRIKKGKVKVVTTSPGGLPVYAVYYGEKENFHSQANYNSAVAAGNPVYYAKKDSTSKPVVFFLVRFTDRKSKELLAWLI